VFFYLLKNLTFVFHLYRKEKTHFFLYVVKKVRSQNKRKVAGETLKQKYCTNLEKPTSSRRLKKNYTIVTETCTSYRRKLSRVQIHEM
jgi:hypothetical protein